MDWYRKRTLADTLEQTIARFGDREALVFQGRRWTYREWGEETDKLAKGLMAMGIQPGDRVALWMTNRPEWLFAMYAVAKIGACLVPLNTRYRSKDISYTLSQSRSHTLLCMDESGPVNYLEILAEAMPVLGRRRPDGTMPEFEDLHEVVVLGAGQFAGTRSWDSLLAAGETVTDQALSERAAAVDPDGLMMIGYTSGTTASPKGVMHTHRPVRNSHERAQLLGMTFADVHLNYLPLFHLYGFSEVAMIAVLSGAKQVLMDVFDADQALDAAVAENATILHGFEAHWLDLLNAQAKKPRAVNMRLGTLPSGVESTIPIAAKAQDVFGPTVSGFGMTEVWAFVTVSNPSHSAEQRINTSGFPMNDYEFKIVDPETGEQKPPGEKGEIWIRGYAVMQGYWEKPAETAEALDADGWLHSGDLGLLREDGNLVFLGRYKDMLKVGGENVSPAEVEAFMREMPEVVDAAEVAYRDAWLTEVPVVFVVLEPDQSLTIDTVISRCKGQIASFKIPRYVVPLEAMPMTPSGKVRKVELRAWALEMLPG